MGHSENTQQWFKQMYKFTTKAILERKSIKIKIESQMIIEKKKTPTPTNNYI